MELDERWVVIGPNGAGKTSLLRIAAAMEYPSSGTAYVLGERLGRVDMSELRARVGLSSSALSQRVPDGEVVRDLVVSAGYAVLGRWRERYDDIDYEQAIDMLESVGAEHLAERTYGTLSEGERKRVLIARSLMTDPELLLLDEPAAGLDLGGREELVARLGDLAADADSPAIVLVTHHVEEIPQGFTHCLILSEGTVVDSGLLTDVLTAENLSKAFGQSIALDVIDGRYFARRTRSRAAHRRRDVTESPDSAAGRDGDAGPDKPQAREGIEVFLMRRHSAMDFVAGVMVFPGGGVDDRDRNADVAWHGPDTAVVGRSVRGGRRARRGAGVRGGAGDVRGVRCAVRRARPTIRTCSSTTPRCTASSGAALENKYAVVRRVPARREAGAARRPAAAVGELGDAEGGTHPSLRHLLLRRCAPAGAARRR